MYVWMMLLEAKMRRMWAAAALIAASCAPIRIAEADPFVGGEPAPLLTCLEQAQVDSAALNACKGVLTRACLAIEGDATMTLALCWSSEHDAWSTVMDATLARLNARDEARRETLQRSHAAWSAWTEIECGYRSDGFGGGSGAQPAYAQCMADLTADRSISLKLEEAAL